MNQQAFLYFLLASSILLLQNLAKAKKSKRKKHLPSPPRLPILGHLHLLNPYKPHHSLLALSNKLGPLILLRLGSFPTLIISSRAIAAEIFAAHDLAFSSRPLLTGPKKLFYNCSSISFSPFGDHWRHARKIIVLELLSPRRVRSLEAVRREEVGKLIAAIKTRSVANISELALSLANNVVCRAALGDRFADGGYNGEGEAWLHRLLRESQRLLGGYYAADFFPGMEWVDRLLGFHGRLEKNFMEIDTFFDRVIWDHVNDQGREEDIEREEDMVDVLLRLHKVAVPGGGFLSSMDHVKAILWESFLAGTDTTGSIITWTMTALIKNPRAMNKLQEELNQVTADNPHSLIQQIQLQKLQYLKQVIKESMRLNPTTPLLVPRETIQPCEIQGYEIPAKTRVIFNAMAISTDAGVWEKPLEFLPERFEGRVDYTGEDFDALPFGFGRRKCPGIGFGMAIVELALANLVHCFDWSMPDGMKVEDISMEEEIGITTHKKEALCLVARPKW